MTGTLPLKDMELLVCLILKEIGPLSLKDLSQCIGALKRPLKEEKASLDETLQSLDGCVDDIPRAVRALMTKGNLVRVGKTPREWRYKLSEDPTYCEGLPKGAIDDIRPLLDRYCCSETASKQ